MNPRKIKVVSVKPSTLVEYHDFGLRNLFVPIVVVTQRGGVGQTRRMRLKGLHKTREQAMAVAKRKAARMAKQYGVKQ